MEAIVVRSLRVISLTFFLISSAQSVDAGSARTQNFIVTAPTAALANEIASEAERFRKELAISWLGHELPAWQEPCPVQAKVSPRLGAGGATSFLFETEQRQFARPVGDGLFQSKPAGRPFGWEMTLQGSRERILDSVLPHEVTHTIFATHFGRPLPRWADEGACTTVEHQSEKAKQHRMLYEFLTTERGIPFNKMFSMTEYPRDILPLYSQGFSLARFLIKQGGRRKFVEYVGDGLSSNDWTKATRSHYGFSSISDLQVTWLSWVRGGSREIPSRQPPATLIASASTPGRRQLKSSWTPVSASSPPTNSFAATTPQKPGGTRSQSFGPTKSWYAQQKEKSQPVRVMPGQAPQEPRGTRPIIATRPNRREHQREVIMEWGEPREFLSPSLANRSADKQQR